MTPQELDKFKRVLREEIGKFKVKFLSDVGRQADDLEEKMIDFVNDRVDQLKRLIERK